jgi:DNA-binding NarL/FixJ family response regulator
MTGNLNLRSTFDGQPPSLENRPIVAFVGNELSFSDQVMRAFNAEFTSLQSIRISSLAEFHLLAQVRSTIALVVFDQAYSQQLAGLIEACKKVCANARVVLAYKDPDIARSTLHDHELHQQETSIGYLPMNRPLDTWLAINSLLIFGENHIPEEILTQSASSPVLRAVDTPLQTEEAIQKPAGVEEPNAETILTTRETEVLENVSAGKQNKIIALDLGVSEHTVKLHIHHIIKKLGVSNRTAASAWFLASKQLDDHAGSNAKHA